MRTNAALQKAYRHAYYRKNQKKIAAQQKAYWQANPDKRTKYEEWARQRRKLSATQVATLKDRPCMDCGLRFPPECMDFDHREGETKIRGVSALLSARHEVLVAEIAKCDLVCANCHRIRTRQHRWGPVVTPET